MKLARKYGHDKGRFEIITMTRSFHGRTLGMISATGQDKVKLGFEPLVEGHHAMHPMKARLSIIKMTKICIFAMVQIGLPRGEGCPTHTIALRIMIITAPLFVLRVLL